MSTMNWAACVSVCVANLDAIKLAEGKRPCAVFLRATAYMPWQFRLSVCLSVCPSVTRVDQSKRLKLGSRNFHRTVAPSL